MNDDVGLDREALSDRLRTALSAIERGDEDGCRAQIRALASWRSGPALAALARLSRELGSALGGLPDPDLELGELPDACARLDHVVELTERATHRTLDLVEKNRAIALRMEARCDSPELRESIAELRANLTELALAQSHQDICGQIVRRVVGLVGRIHATLSALGFAAVRPADGDRAALAGPVVDGLDRHGVSQGDADDLLSGLGL